MLEAAIGKLDRYDLPLLDDLACVAKDQAETISPGVLGHGVLGRRASARLVCGYFSGRSAARP